MTTTTFTTSVITQSDDPIYSFAADGDVLVVNAGVTLSNQGNTIAAGVDGLQDLKAIINGTVSTPGWAAINVFTSSIDLTVGSTGRLESDGAMVIEASNDSTLTNHGTLDASRGFGVVITDATTAAVVNSGTIFGEVGAIEFTTSVAGSAVSVTNHGRLQGGAGAQDSVSGAGSNQTIYSDAGTTTIANDGHITSGDKAGAAIKIAGGALHLENTGGIRAAAYIGVVVQGADGAEIVNEGTIAGNKGALSLSSGADAVTNDGFLDGRVALGAGNDVFHGENGSVAGAIWGQAGNDLLAGGANSDVIAGGTGSDTLTGGAGRDVLTGAAGADVLSGGTGDDVFRFVTTADAAGDRIIGGAGAFEGVGIAGGDHIDVSAIDANSAASGHPGFIFGTSHALGHLWAVDVGDVTHIRGNTGGSTAPEFDLAIRDGVGVHASDYAGLDFIL